MALTITTLKQSFFDVGPANAAILAALGNGAASWIPRTALRSPAPTAPFVAVQFGAMPGAREDVRTLYPTLWIFDDDLYGWTRINALSTLIDQAYTEDCIAYCHTAGGAGEELTDGALNRPVMPMRYQVRARF
jgi:hypothetical protein